MADMIKFYKGLEASLPATGTNGALYITTDEGGIYLGTGTGMKRLGDFVQVANVDALPAKAHENCLYYCVAENILAKWNGVEWKQVNKQPTVEELKTLLGLGTAAYTDADAYDAAGSAAAVRTYVGDIPNGEDGNPMAESVIAYINKKTDGIATSGNLEALGNRVTTAEGEIDALQEASAKHVEKEEGKSLIADTEIARLAGMSDGANKVEKSETNGNIKVDGAEVVVYTHPEKHAIADVDGLEERIAAIEGNFGDGEGTVESKIEAAVSAETTAREEAVKGVQDEVDAVEGRMDTAEGKITALEGASATHAVKTEVEAALALKADKSVVEAMYTNEQIDTAVQGAKDYAKGLVDDLPEQTDYTVTITENTDDATVAKTYVFTQNGAEIGAIKLAKELVVTSGSVKEVETADAPYAGAVVGDKYIELVIANQDAPIYVPAKDLVDIYTAKDGAAEVQVAISNTNEISATLVNGGITEEKLAEGVKTKLNKVWEEVGVAAGLDATLKTELQKEIDDDVKAAIDAEVIRADGAYDKKGAAAAAQSAAEAKVTELAGNTYTKEQTFTKDEVNAAIEEAVAEACSWGTFGE